MNFKTKLAAACGTALVVLSSVGILSYRWAVSAGEDQRWIAHTHKVLEKLDVVVADTLSAETDQQEYVFTAEGSRPVAYQGDLHRIEKDLNEVAALTSDNPRQQDSLGRLRTLISTRLPTGQEIPGGLGQKSTKAKTMGERAGLARQSVQEILSLVSTMKVEEGRLLTQRSDAAQASSRRMREVLVLGNILAVLFLLVAALVIRQENIARIKAEETVRQNEERFRLMVSSVKEYAILMLDPEGNVVSWNAGAERIKGYRAAEIIGQHFSRFYPAGDLNEGKPQYELKTAAEQGQFEDEGWRVRKDGSKFWASVLITPLRAESGRLRGFVKVTRDMTDRRRAEEQTKHQNAKLETANRELEAFSYSVAHDLRAPLRAIDGFSLALLEDYEEQLQGEGKLHLQRIRTGASRMAQLIEDLLNLARISRYEIARSQVDLSLVAEEVASQLKTSQPDRQAYFSIAPDLRAFADRNLLRIVLENLLGNAWKFTSKQPHAQIELGVQNGNGERIYFVRDNGPGFDMQYANKLFGVFQRLHRDAEFPGTGIGLATVQRIINRHGGRIWAEAALGRGATFYFVL